VSVDGTGPSRVNVNIRTGKDKYGPGVDLYIGGEDVASFSSEVINLLGEDTLIQLQTMGIAHVMAEFQRVTAEPVDHMANAERYLANEGVIPSGPSAATSAGPGATPGGGPATPRASGPGANPGASAPAGGASFEPDSANLGQHPDAANWGRNNIYVNKSKNDGWAPYVALKLADGVQTPKGKDKLFGKLPKGTRVDQVSLQQAVASLQAAWEEEAAA